ncbi:MAG: hypothetical protein M3511_06700 [Deinococcota bacterium]|jgi:hypothetical protein|nr:hypothetical protein [Deinococcota bacterium]
MATLKRQFITAAAGKPVGVILPFEEYAFVEKLHEDRTHAFGTGNGASGKLQRVAGS